MSDHVFRPEPDGEFLVSEDGATRIEPTPHLYLAMHDPVLSLQASGIFSGTTRFNFYRAIRLQADTLVEGIFYKEQGSTAWDGKPARSDGTVLEGGSLLLRSFEPAAKGQPVESGAVQLVSRALFEPVHLERQQGAWWALSLRQQGQQNMQRSEHKPENGSVGVPEAVMGRTCSQTGNFARQVSGTWKDQRQAQAHIKDERAYFDARNAATERARRKDRHFIGELRR
jgi:hypothetical protein